MDIIIYSIMFVKYIKYRNFKKRLLHQNIRCKSLFRILFLIKCPQYYHHSLKESTSFLIVYVYSCCFFSSKKTVLVMLSFPSFASYEMIGILDLPYLLCSRSIRIESICIIITFPCSNNRMSLCRILQMQQQPQSSSNADYAYSS